MPLGLLAGNVAALCHLGQQPRPLVAKEIGALAASLGGLDALVFTAGIGENSPEIRRRIGEACDWLGVSLDAAANEAGAGPRISAPGAKVSAWVVPTNEELMIARHARMLLGLD